MGYKLSSSSSKSAPKQAPTQELILYYPVIGERALCARMDLWLENTFGNPSC